MDTLLLKPDEAAAQLRLSRATLYQLLASGRLRSIAVGRARRIPRQALSEFIELLMDEQGHRSGASFAPMGRADVPDASTRTTPNASAESQVTPAHRLPRSRQ